MVYSKIIGTLIYTILHSCLFTNIQQTTRL